MQLFLITTLMTGCAKTTMKEKMVELNLDDVGKSGQYISDIYTDKSSYKPKETAKLILDLENPKKENLDGIVKIYLKKLSKNIEKQQIDISLTAGEIKQVEVRIPMPADDFTGYSVEAYLYKKDALLDYEMSAIDVSSDWSMFPRYAYLTNMKERSAEESRKVLDRLLKHHINGLFYYDVIDQHDKPLAGTPENPESNWNTLAWHKVSKKTLEDMITIGHEYNMNSFIYNLIFGSYDNYEKMGISKEWGLFRDGQHQNQDNHDLSGLGWETKKLWLFNPDNKGWQDYYLKVHKDLFSVFNFDGIQVDSLGGRGNLYDYLGNTVVLNKTYSSLLNRLGKEMNTRVLFNPVGGYGMPEQLNEVDYDILYMEVWPGDHKTYSSLKNALDSLYRSTKGEKGAVIAAYMNYGKRKNGSGGSFNNAGVNFTNATLIAAGGSHLELGDTGMLSGEYYPGNTLKINQALEDSLRNYYSFMVAYENLFRGTGLNEVITKTYVDEHMTSFQSEPGRIWSFTKTKGEDTEILNLINLTDAKQVDWVDDMGTQPAPKVLKGKTVKHYVTVKPSKVSIASPDYHNGIMEDVKFQAGKDEKGDYISFQLPYLKYWTTVVIQ